MDPLVPAPVPDPDKVANLVDFAAFLDGLAGAWEMRQREFVSGARPPEHADLQHWRPLYVSDFLRAWSDTIRHEALAQPEQVDPDATVLTWQRLSQHVMSASTGSPYGR